MVSAKYFIKTHKQFGYEKGVNPPPPFKSKISHECDQNEPQMRAEAI